jgi:hypothetical protein
MMRGLRAALASPKLAFTWAPAGSKRAVLSMVRNCVWLRTLNISQRSCSRRRPWPPRPKFLKKARFQLLMPGFW